MDAPLSHSLNSGHHFLKEKLLFPGIFTSRCGLRVDRDDLMDGLSEVFKLRQLIASRRVLENLVEDFFGGHVGDSNCLRCSMS